MTKLFNFIGITALLVALIGSANGAVRYRFSTDLLAAWPSLLSMEFVYTAPDFIVATSTVPASQLDSCSVLTMELVAHPCGPMGFFPNPSGLVGTDPERFDVIGFGYSPTETMYFYFADGALSSFGNHRTIYFEGEQEAHVLVTPVPDKRLPESGTLGLLGIGLAGLSFTRRRTHQ